MSRPISVRPRDPTVPESPQSVVHGSSQSSPALLLQVGPDHPAEGGPAGPVLLARSFILRPGDRL